MAFSVVSQAQRARRRQQRPAIDEDLLDWVLWRTWICHTTAHARDDGNPRRYPAMSERWGAALEAARAGALLEGQKPRGGARKLDPESVCAIRARHAAGESFRSIARSYDVAHNAIVNVVYGASWAHVGRDE